jgi:carbonic anhydrase/acetyltransferase-like protein (isoleucine patch superfamily)
MINIDIGDKKLQTDGENYWIAPNATIIGEVILSKDASVWFNAVLRADNEPILVGEGSNVQDGAIIHTDPGFPCSIGKNVTVGHLAMLHGCDIGEGSLIGIGSVVLNGAKIGKNCIIGSKALVTEGMEIPDGAMVLGVPGKVKKMLNDEEQSVVSLGAAHYVENYKKYKELTQKNED